jgi:hypothetical protein
MSMEHALTAVVLEMVYFRGYIVKSKACPSGHVLGHLGSEMETVSKCPPLRQFNQIWSTYKIVQNRLKLRS